MISEVIADLKARGSDAVMDDDFAKATEEWRKVSRQPSWQVSEVKAAVDELETGEGVCHEKVATWLKSWGTARETNAPR
jgi:predicted transcriptional regulator